MKSEWRLKEGVLCHHGIEGQKWGERNGPPYPLDAKTAARVSKKNKTKSFLNKATTDSIKTGKGKDNITPAERFFNKSHDITKETKDMLETSRSFKKTASYEKVYQEASKMTDQELRSYINRANLERQYVDLKSPNTTKGYQYTQASLSLIGSLLATGASAASLALTIRKVMR